MTYDNIDVVLRHKKTHTERSAEDRAAVSVLETFLRSNGRINTSFTADDKWPNIDGTFEYVSNPNKSRKPEQNFFVQIKGTTCYTESNGIVKYSLKSLAFPAFIYTETTLDPGILFVVLNPESRGQERVFWKYISHKFLDTIDFNHESTTISFSESDEIKNTEESIDNFCFSLSSIISQHLFVNQLDNIAYSSEQIINIIKACDKDISDCIERIEILNDTRDNVSRLVLNRLMNLCVAVMLYNTISKSKNSKTMSLRLAFERSLFDINTKYLCDFLKGLKYIGNRIPQEGQSERLMLKYYNFLWQIRKQLKENHNINILSNLEKFPLKELDKVDKEYYDLVALAIESVTSTAKSLSKARYYIQKKTAFYVGSERYFEMSLQLSGMYATKYNRITIYTKENISTDYPIQIAYEESSFSLWDTDMEIIIVTDWRVSIEPSSLNKLGKTLYKQLKINSNYGEYNELMIYLTKTGINLNDIIDLNKEMFKAIIKEIFADVNTTYIKELLEELRIKCSKDSTVFGKNTLRYLLIRLNESNFESVLPDCFSPSISSTDVYLSKKCLPFEKRPLISNLAGSKTSNRISEILSFIDYNDYILAKPYLTIKSLTDQTGEIYFNSDEILGKNSLDIINDFNYNLDDWERSRGYSIENENGVVWISSYEKSTLNIINNLLKRSDATNKGQAQVNNAFVAQNESVFNDKLKMQAVKNAFVTSNLLLIYGAAGTGKTTLINYLSNLMRDRKKLFLTKTHTALRNLKRQIDNPGTDSDFVSIDSFTKKVNLQEYDIVFVDECSTIDNYTMNKFLQKLNPNTLLVLAGDIYQIESIEFGNWFYYAKQIIKNEGSNVELLNTWRTKDENLIGLWDEVRKKDILITEKLAIDGPYSENICESILKPISDDEIVLCLNYDGKFGLNNINKYFQNANSKSEAYKWQEWNYKVGDKILFNETKRFPSLYNNLKGRIVAIQKTKNDIVFTVDVETLLTERDCSRENINFIEAFDNSTRISFDVYSEDKEPNESNDDFQMCTVVPFQLAYAVSIHKAQGLEYDSVKIIIPESNAEKITHGVFYTAITRAKKHLKIFWSSETMQSIVQSFSQEQNNNRSLNIIKSKLIENNRNEKAAQDSLK